jgi:release factor glutamine methyltransferase
LLNNTVSSLIRSITTRLSDAGIEDAGLEARLLVRHAFGWSSEQQLGMLPEPTTFDQIDVIEPLVSRRLDREPLHYITGKVEFFRRQFAVDETVLIPRPETEQLVVQTIEFVRTWKIKRPRIADICTGSGVIAVTLALEMPDSEVAATDISSSALVVANKNAENLNADVDFQEGNLLDPLCGQFDVIVSNPPYILHDAMANLQPEVDREPKLALDAGVDGLEQIRPLMSGISKSLKPSLSAAYIEIDPPIADAVLELAHGLLEDASISLLTDLTGLIRCVAIER